jgi:membrane protease YdiL (CAAX protease family)
MKHFLAPYEAKNSWLVYLASIIFVFVGVFSFGSIASYSIISSRVQVTPTTTEEDISAAFTYNEQFIITLVPFLIGFALLVFVAKVLHQRTFLSFITSRDRFDLKRFGIGFLVWGLIVGALFGIEIGTGQTQLRWIFEWDSFLYLFFISIFLVPFQTGFEEVIVRGFTMQLFGRVTKRASTAILSSALIFGILHMGNPELDSMGLIVLVFYVTSGIMTALITVLDDGIELSWGFHTANNFFSILIVTSDYQAFRTDALFLDKSDPAVGFEILIVPFIFFPLFVFVLWRIFKWKNWKEKLFGKLPLTYPSTQNDVQDDDA